MILTRRTRLLVDDGRVWCALRERDVDVDGCFTCPRFSRVSNAGERQTIVCDSSGSEPRSPGLPITWSR